MRYYQHPATTTYSTFEAPEDKSPLEWRPTLEKGEETHVRDCLTWHGPSPRYTYRNHNYRMYTHDGRDYWTSHDCGNPGCRSCRGDDILTSRDIGYVRRNELGRTVDRGFSSKPWKLRMQEATGNYGDGSWTQRFEPGPDSARDGGGMRDPFNRPVGDQGKPWNTSRYDHDMHHKGMGGGHGYKNGCDCKNGGCGGGHGCKNGCDCKSGGWGGAGSNGGGFRGGSDPSYDLNTYRSTFPRIDEKDQGSISYRPLGGTGPAAMGYNRPPADDFDSRPVGGGGATYRSPPPAASQSQPNFDSGYQGASSGGMNGFGGNGGFGGGGGGGAAARGNDAPFRLKDDPTSSTKSTSRRELKGPNTAVAFTV